MRSLLLLAILGGCRAVERVAVRVLSDDYDRAAVDTDGLTPTFDAVDADKPRIDVALVPVASGLPQVTDIQAVPGRDDQVVVLTKPGTAYRVDLTTGVAAPWFTADVVTVSEQGLLGLAFHPEYPEDPRFFVNLTPAGVRPEVSRVEAWRGTVDAVPERMGTVLEVRQPYQNHNAGQLAFGPDGMLYVGWGDGGLRDDPDDNGQDGTTLLGAMLRIDVSATPYGVPADNPFVGDASVRDEVWALGLRNPWRYAFTPDGRLVVADVGQDSWEEVSIVRAGDNLGWSRREGDRCFPPGRACPPGDFVDPVWTYGREAGQSVTGGVVATGGAAPSLAGKYLVGDFVSGRLWALDLPADRAERAIAHALGKWPILPSTFGRTNGGDVLVADFAGGTIYRIVE